MATGVSSPLGYSIPQVGGMFPIADIYDPISKRRPALMYELNLSSYPPKFKNGTFVSPLTTANAPLYKHNYGSKKKKNCTKFNKNKNVNPSTGRPIKRGSKTYKSLDKECKKTRISKKMCESFLNSDKTINPLTGRAIKKDGPTYNIFMNKCKSINSDLSIFKSKLPKEPEDYPIQVKQFRDYPIEVKPIPLIKPGVSKYPKYPGNPGVKIYPVWQQPDPSDHVSNGTKYTIQPRKFISFNGKEFKVGSNALVDTIGTKAVITNIGTKQITLKKDLTSKENRLTIETFLKFNT
jgi:hypothetical protein